MIRKERFLAALQRKPVDKVPLFDFLFQQPMYQTLIGHYPKDGAYNGRDAVLCALALEHDAVWVPFGGFSGYKPEFLRENVYKDEWGTTYQRDKAAWPIDSPIAYPIKTREDFLDYKAPDPSSPGRDSEITAAVNTPNDDMAVLGGVAGPFSTAWLLMGFENLSYALYDEPDLVTDVFRMAVDFSKEAARRCVQAGCCGIWVSEDLGDNKSGFINLEMFRTYLLPYLSELVDYIADLGVPVLLHSCGCITMYLDDLAKTRISAIHPLQRTANMDLRSVKEKYGERFCIIGNIDSSRTLPFGTPADVEAEVREAIAIAAPGGGYILASDHSLHDGIPIENIIALRDAGLKYGKYK